MPGIPLLKNCKKILQHRSWIENPIFVTANITKQVLIYIRTFSGFLPDIPASSLSLILDRNVPALVSWQTALQKISSEQLSLSSTAQALNFIFQSLYLIPQFLDPELPFHGSIMK